MSEKVVPTVPHKLNLFLGSWIMHEGALEVMEALVSAQRMPPQSLFAASSTPNVPSLPPFTFWGRGCNMPIDGAHPNANQSTSKSHQKSSLS